TTNPWIRTYGLTSGWGYAISKGNDRQLGLWGWYLANRMAGNRSMPICIINGAVGGTRIDQHRPNPADHGAAGTLYSIYANLYNRVVGAKLTHGIRAVLWHQGENSQGSAGPDGDYDYKFYQQYFVDISAAWKQDFPNIRKYYLFQIWPGACGDTSRNDQLREVQRTLPRLYSNMRIMSTLGIVPGSSCHYTEAGYMVFSDLIGPLVEQDSHGIVPPQPMTAPNLQRAYFTTAAKNEIALVFDLNVTWNPGATTMLFLADANGTTTGSVSSGSASGNTIKLQVTGAAAAAAITYVKGLVSWQQANLLKGTNDIAALTFADVAIGPPPPAGASASGGIGQIMVSWNATAGATSYKVKRSTVSGGPYATVATTAGTTFTDLSVVSGTAYYYVISAMNTVGTSSSEGPDSAQVSAAPLTAFAAWAASPAQGLTAGVNDGPLMDPDFDGIPNLLEFVLNSAPMTPSSAAQPTMKQDAGQWVFEYYRSDDSLPPTTSQTVQYSVDLSAWTDIPVTAASSGAVTITPGTPADLVRVVIPNVSGKTFARLKISQ
ncbi:MAG: sialate O-acetylesterase, partial [Verrucomicrobia bacterium]|nr:sialate O-acetylesterase [Verrucomicrobiota bacterium]